MTCASRMRVSRGICETLVRMPLRPSPPDWSIRRQRSVKASGEISGSTCVPQMLLRSTLVMSLPRLMSTGDEMS